MPEVGVYDSPEVNAFATGPSKSRSLVAVSSGLLRAMRQEEVEGVLAHEVAHIANGDMVTMTLLQGVINAFVMFVARVVAHLMTRTQRRTPGNGGGMHFLIVIVLADRARHSRLADHALVLAAARVPRRPLAAPRWRAARGCSARCGGWPRTASWWTRGMRRWRR